MKHFTPWVSAAIGVLVSSAIDGDGIIWIFNGKDLSGWKSNEETPGCFTVEDGELKVGGGRAHLFYVDADGKEDFKGIELNVLEYALAASSRRPLSLSVIGMRLPPVSMKNPKITGVIV